MGGKSSRMKEEKALLVYHEKPQYHHIYDLLKKFCPEVYLSQKKNIAINLPTIFDKKEYQNIGPLAGLISAYETKKSAFLLFAIDYPLINEKDIEKLISERDSNFHATVYYNENDFFEPYLGIYEVSFYEIIKTEIEQGNYSLQQILKKNHVQKVSPINPETLKSIDNQEARLHYLNQYK